MQIPYDTKNHFPLLSTIIKLHRLALKDMGQGKSKLI